MRVNPLTLLAAALCLLVSGRVWACESYEECINPDKRFYDWDSCYDSLCRHKYDCPAGKDKCSRLASCEECADYSYVIREKREQRAIAFKLAELTEEVKKLNSTKSSLDIKNPTNPDPSKYVLQSGGDGCIRWFDPKTRKYWKDGAAGTAYACESWVAEEVKKLTDAR